MAMQIKLIDVVVVIHEELKHFVGISFDSLKHRVTDYAKCLF